MSPEPVSWKSPKATLRACLREMQVALHARELYDRLPVTRVISEGLAWHMTDRFPYPAIESAGGTPPLLHVCLRHAFEGMDAVLPATTSVRAVQTAYLQGLFRHVFELTNVWAVDAQGERWNPLGPTALSVWLTERAGVSFVAPADGHVGAGRVEEIRSMILARIVPADALVALNVDLGAVINGPAD